MNALDLLDEYLVRIGNKLYSKSKVDFLYVKFVHLPFCPFDHTVT